MRFVCFRPRKNNQLCIQNHGQGIHSAKMGVVLRLKIPQFPQNFGFLKKNLEEIQNQTAIGKIEKRSKYRKKIERSNKDQSPNRKGK